MLIRGRASLNKMIGQGKRSGLPPDPSSATVYQHGLKNNVITVYISGIKTLHLTVLCSQT